MHMRLTVVGPNNRTLALTGGGLSWGYACRPTSQASAGVPENARSGSIGRTRTAAIAMAGRPFFCRSAQGRYRRAVWP